MEEGKVRGQQASHIAREHRAFPQMQDQLDVSADETQSVFTHILQSVNYVHLSVLFCAFPEPRILEGMHL
jgi:hypothetical protein